PVARGDRCPQPLGPFRLWPAAGGQGAQDPGCRDRHLWPRGGGRRARGAAPPRPRDAAQGIRLHGPCRDRPRLGLHASQGRDQLVPPVPRAHHGIRRESAGQAPEGRAQGSGAQEAALDNPHLGRNIMALTFYFGSGSPFAWKVWLVLEHKGIAYTPKRLSFDKDETRSPEFL